MTTDAIAQRFNSPGAHGSAGLGQVTARAFRIAQTKNVQVHKFLCVGAPGERIDEMIGRKTEVAENVVGTGDPWLTKLSTDELKELFALQKEAVAQQAGTTRRFRLPPARQRSKMSLPCERQRSKTSFDCARFYRFDCG